MKYTLTFTILRLASGFVGVASVGGINIRGGRRDTQFAAAQSLFLVLSGGSGNTDDAAIAVDLMLANSTLEDAMTQIGPGEGEGS